MTRHWILAALATPGIVLGQQGQEPVALTLAETVELAVSASPDLLAARGATEAAQGLRAAATWPFSSNPSAEFSRTRRLTAEAQTHDIEWRVTQGLELSGASLRRREAGNSRISASRATVEDVVRWAALEARLAYSDLHMAERRAHATAENALLAQGVLELVQLQLEAGEVSALALNTAALDAARAQSLADRAEADRLAAAARLMRLLPRETAGPVATTELPALPSELPSPGVLTSLAIERRPDLAAAHHAVEAARHQLAAIRRTRIPTLEVAVFGGQEAGNDDLLGVGIGVSIPLFARQQAQMGEARADRSAALAAADATVRAVHSDVAGWTGRFRTARRSERQAAGQLLRASGDNVALATQALREGEWSVADVVVFRSTALAARLEYLEVLGMAYEAWFQLAAAVNTHPDELPALEGGDA